MAAKGHALLHDVFEGEISGSDAASPDSEESDVEVDVVRGPLGPLM